MKRIKEVKQLKIFLNTIIVLAYLLMVYFACTNTEKVASIDIVKAFNIGFGVISVVSFHILLNYILNIEIKDLKHFENKKDVWIM